MVYRDPERQLAYSREWKRKKRYEIRLEVIHMLGGKCVDCPIDDVRVLQIDHIIPLQASRNDSLRSGDTLIKGLFSGKISLSSVALRCANCHMIKTSKDKFLFHHYKGPVG